MNSTPLIRSFLFCCALAVASAETGSGTSNAGENPTGRIEVWSYSKEIYTMLSDYYAPVRETLDISYREIATDQFPRTLDSAFASHSPEPDVVTLEQAFLRQYVESGNLLDITGVADGLRSTLLSYPIELATHEGKVYALSWQAVPGAMFYRRSLAKKYLGSDDPDTIQQYFSNFDAFLNTARTLKEKSGGTCRIVPSSQDIFIPLKGLKKRPWIENEKHVIDDSMSKYLELSKTLREEGLDLDLAQWSSLWFAGMRGTLQTQDKAPLEIFSYFLPTWGLHYVLKTNAPDTSGDWAMIQGPSAWFWGGSWIAASKYTDNPETAKDLIRFLVSDGTANRDWAIKTGDLVTNTEVLNEIKNLFEESFLQGQNHYKEFARFAEAVSGKGYQRTDTLIEGGSQEAVNRYANGELTRDEALRLFIKAVGERTGYSP